MTQQLHPWLYIQKSKHEFVKIHAPQRPYYLQWSRHGSNLSVSQRMNE